MSTTGRNITTTINIDSFVEQCHLWARECQYKPGLRQYTGMKSNFFHKDISLQLLLHSHTNNKTPVPDLTAIHFVFSLLAKLRANKKVFVQRKKRNSLKTHKKTTTKKKNRWARAGLEKREAGEQDGGTQGKLQIMTRTYPRQVVVQQDRHKHRRETTIYIYMWVNWHPEKTYTRTARRCKLLKPRSGEVTALTAEHENFMSC